MVDRTLDAIHACGAKNPEELKQLAADDHVLSMLWEGKDFAWPTAPMTVAYVERVVTRELAAVTEPATELQPLVETSAYPRLGL